MARLTLDEGGEVRRFKLSSGKLTFGSGEGVTLRLSSDDVAERHGVIEMGPDGATLKIAKGVMPAKAAGAAVSGSYLMKDGQAVTIGSAKLSIEYDAGEGPAKPKGAAPRRAAASGGSSSRSKGRSGGGRVSSSRRQQSKGPAIPASVGAGLVVVALVVVGYLLLNQTSKGLAGENFDFNASWGRYQRERIDDPVGARATLTQLAGEELTPQQRLMVEKAQQDKDEKMGELDDSVRNQKITPWVDVRLIKYSESKWNPKGERPHARVFMKRARWFVEAFPTHPSVDRVRRLMERIEPVAETGSANTLEDVRWDVWGMTAAEPKDFRGGFASIAKFAATADGPDKTGAEQLRQELVTAEREFYDEKLADAAVVYDRVKYPKKYNPTDAIEDMVRIIVACDTPALRDDAAQRLLQISEFTPALLEGYKRTQPPSQPYRYERLIGEPGLRAFAKENGVE